MAQSKSYYEQANPDLLQDTRGCQNGPGDRIWPRWSGKAYKAINPNVTYIGIEVVPEQVKKQQKPGPCYRTGY